MSDSEEEELADDVDAAEPDSDDEEEDEDDSDDEEENEKAPEEEEDAEVVSEVCSAAAESDLTATLDEVAQFDANEVHDVIRRWHPRETIPTRVEVAEKLLVHRGGDERVVDDDLHTLSKMTKFEFAGIIGKRVAQMNHGSPPFIETDLLDNHLIAREELRQKKVPFIIRRYLPGGEEFVRVRDLEIMWDV